MKIQSKLGGVTHEVPIPQAVSDYTRPPLTRQLDKTTMMIGADVTHPPAVRAGESLHPSIAVTVGAKTGDNVTFRPCVRLQQGRM
jgi:eukaryotic translation initiation factor 2C